MFTSQDQEVAYALTFAIGASSSTEIATSGHEGVTYGAITTYTACGQTIALVLSNSLLPIWPSNASRDELRCDTGPVKDHMALLTGAACVIAVGGLASALTLLVHRKRRTSSGCSRKKFPSSALVGWAMIGLLGFLMVFGARPERLPHD